jgi:hypothetical protein
LKPSFNGRSVAVVAADDFVSVIDGPHRNRVACLHVAALFKVCGDCVNNVFSQ